jgi:hypothetical protein
MAVDPLSTDALPSGRLASEDTIFSFKASSGLQIATYRRLSSHLSRKQSPRLRECRTQIEIEQTGKSNDPSFLFAGLSVLEGTGGLVICYLSTGLRLLRPSFDSLISQEASGEPVELHQVSYSVCLCMKEQPLYSEF